MANEGHSITVIGTEFVRRYYTVLHENPKELSKFYGDKSIFLHADDKDGFSDDAVTGQEEIEKKIESLKLSDCFAKIRQVDCQSTINDCILIQVSGIFSQSHKPWRTFVQSILLARATNKYYARNDIFRYQQPKEQEYGEEAVDYEEVDQEETENAKEVTESLPAEPSIEQNRDSETKISNEATAKKPDSQSSPSKKVAPKETQKPESPSKLPNVSKNQEPDNSQETDKLDGKEEVSKKKETSGPFSWADLASKPAHTPSNANAEAPVRKPVRKLPESTAKTTRSNQHHKDVAQPQRSQNTRAESQQQRNGQPTDHQIFIGGLSPEVAAEDLKKKFSVFGEVKHVKVNLSKGFGFISFENGEGVNNALASENNIYIGEHHINIERKKSINKSNREGGQRHSNYNRQNKSGGGYRGERGGRHYEQK